jgi:uncharacterized membrane protein
MDLESALVSFPKINDAAKAYAAARDRSGPEASWPKEVGFIEHHQSGKVVLRGNFAGHYVDVDEGLHVSQVGAAEGFLVGAILGVLLGGPPGFAAGLVAGATVGSQFGNGENDPEPEVLVERLRAAVPRAGSAIILIAEPSEVDEMLAGLGDRSEVATLTTLDADVTRTTLHADDVAALQKSLSEWPAASDPPSWRGEEAVDKQSS